MDLGTDYCYAGVLLALPRSLTRGARRMPLNEGARKSWSRQAIAPAKYDEGTFTTNHNAATGERGYHNIPTVFSEVGEI